MNKVISGMPVASTAPKNKTQRVLPDSDYFRVSDYVDQFDRAAKAYAQQQLAIDPSAFFRRFEKYSAFPDQLYRRQSWHNPPRGHDFHLPDDHDVVMRKEPASSFQPPKFIITRPETQAIQGSEKHTNIYNAVKANFPNVKVHAGLRRNEDGTFSPTVYVVRGNS